jgi:hypothetical protein
MDADPSVNCEVVATTRASSVGGLASIRQCPRAALIGILLALGSIHEDKGEKSEHTKQES